MAIGRGYGPDQLQRPNVWAAKHHGEIHMHVGMVHLDDLEERPVTHSDVCDMV